MDTSKHGGRNPLVDAVQDLDILGGRGPREAELDAIRGEKVADRVEDDPRFGRVAADPGRGVEAANPAGSFEAFLTMMGGGAGPQALAGTEQAQAGGGE